LNEFEGADLLGDIVLICFTGLGAGVLRGEVEILDVARHARPEKVPGFGRSPVPGRRPPHPDVLEFNADYKLREKIEGQGWKIIFV